MVLRLLKQIIKVGEATVRYPFAPIEISAGFRGKPEHDATLCIACAACIQACPPNALSMEIDDELGIQTWTIFYGRCIYCARCEEVCPTGAIQLKHEFELAVMKKPDLYYRAEYRMKVCRQCGSFFASEKEVEYALALIKQAGVSDEAMAVHRNLAELCPACRRMSDLRKMIDLYRVKNEELE
jgi:hydrogenase-4 component H